MHAGLRSEEHRFETYGFVRWQVSCGGDLMGRLLRPEGFNMSIRGDVEAAQRDDRVRPASRALAVLVIPFLVVAAAMLWFWPEDTGRLFAWPIKPPMTAMFLATAYVGGIYFFFRVVFGRQWHRVKVGFLPVATFASLLGIATALHWDRFTHGHVSFWAWATLYFMAPPLVLAAWWSNRRHDPGVRADDDPALPPLLRLALSIAAVAVLALGALLFVQPGILIPVWAWKLTPLTARVVAAIVAMQGVALLYIASDDRWSAASVMLEAELVTTPLMAIAALRARSDFDAAGSSAPAMAGALGLAWLATLALFVWMRRRRRGRLGTSDKP
jgi:hypothetical protein